MTAEYGLTTTFGDTRSAEHAGEEYNAGEPDLLRWVHITIPWAYLGACDRWGP